MKIKNKGKVHPSPSSSSSSDHADVLQLLPAAILALASVLCVEDREVLAYLITRSMKDASIFLESSKKKWPLPSSSSSSKKKPFPHNPPLFHCDCFDCYTSYWFRWDSSPNRELIHQVIDAFEDHLANGENAKKNGHRGKKKERTSRTLADVPPQNTMAFHESPPPDVADGSELVESQVKEPPTSISPARTDNAEVSQQLETETGKAEAVAAEEEEEELSGGFPPMPASNNHNRGLARMVLPNVMGLLNSRLWNLWGPNV